MTKDTWLLVDGYNVLYNWSETASLMDTDLAQARDRLADIVSNYAAFKGCLPVVVFDAYAVKGEDVVEKRAGVDVVFTGEGETADSYIEKAAYSLLREKRVVFVVTGDQHEQIAILGMGANRMTAKELIDDCLKVRKEITEIVADARPPAGRREVAGRLDPSVMGQLESLRRGTGKSK